MRRLLARGQQRQAPLDSECVAAGRRTKPVNWLRYIKKGDLSRCRRRSTGPTRASPDGGEKQASGRSPRGERAVVYGDLGGVLDVRIWAGEVTIHSGISLIQLYGLMRTRPKVRRTAATVLGAYRKSAGASALSVSRATR